MAAQNSDNTEPSTFGRRDVIRAAAVMAGAGALTLVASPAHGATSIAAPERTLVGAIRWDAWVGRQSSFGSAVNRSLSPEKYRYRLPFYATTQPGELLAEDLSTATPGTRPSGWALTESDESSVTVVACLDTTGNAVQLHTRAGAAAGMARRFPSADTAITATWTWKEQSVDGEGGATLSDGITPIIELVTRGDAGSRELVMRSADGSWLTVQAMTADVWYAIKVIVDLAPPLGAARWVDVFVDGLRKVNHAPLPRAASKLDGLSFHRISTEPAQQFVHTIGVDLTESVNCDATPATVMDREIRFANAAGIDYWAFVYYPQEPLSSGRNLYLSRARMKDVRWCAVLDSNFTNNFTKYLSDLVDHFRNGRYQTVLDGRPLVYFFTGATVSNVSALRAAASAAGLANPYIVAMAWTAAAAAELKATVGADAVSRYVTGLTHGASYDDLATYEAGLWDEYGAAAGPVVPTVSTGWDKRPRYDYPVPWEPNFTGFKDQWVAQGTPAQIANHLDAAIHWGAANPSHTPVRNVLIYAWNEFDEGGWICPTLYEMRDSGRPLRLEAISSVPRRRR